MPTVSRPPLSMSPVASCFASMTGSCSCGTTTVVTNRTRSVHADSAPSSVRHSGLSNAMRSPQHSDEKGPPSMTRAHVFSVAASRLGSITGMVIPIRTWAILACVSRRVIEARRLAAIAGAASPERPTSAPRGTPRTACARTAGLDTHVGRDCAAQICRDAECAEHGGPRDHVNDNTSGQHDAHDQCLARRESEGLRALLDLRQTGELARRVNGQKRGDEDTDDDSGLADLR